MGSVFQRRNDQTTEVDDVKNGLWTDETMMHAAQTEDNLIRPFNYLKIYQNTYTKESTLNFKDQTEKGYLRNKHVLNCIHANLLIYQQKLK